MVICCGPRPLSADADPTAIQAPRPSSSISSFSVLSLVAVSDDSSCIVSMYNLVSFVPADGDDERTVEWNG